MTAYQLAAFGLLTIVLVVISRKSLRSPRSHGFYRFFAWEFIAALAILNLGVWFKTPWAWHQILSWLLLCLGLLPLVLGIHALKSRGKPQAQRSGEPQLLGFEKTSQLVDSGIYAVIRHPLYTSLLMLTWGIFFKQPGWPGFLLALAASACLFATARADEVECLRYFGEAYARYMQRTRRFIPYLF